MRNITNFVHNGQKRTLSAMGLMMVSTSLVVSSRPRAAAVVVGRCKNDEPRVTRQTGKNIPLRLLKEHRFNPITAIDSSHSMESDRA